MIEEICETLNNWFCTDDDKRAGTFTIANGGITLDFVSAGQYFRIVGSTHNDGVFRYPATTADALIAETFTGEIWPMKIPRAVLRLAAEIDTWQTTAGTPGPFASESFGGYSYSRATNANGDAVTWQDAFKARLRQWRKV